MNYLDLRKWKKTIQSDKKMLKFVEEKHVGQIRKGREKVIWNHIKLIVVDMNTGSLHQMY